MNLKSTKTKSKRAKWLVLSLIGVSIIGAGIFLLQNANRVPYNTLVQGLVDLKETVLASSPGKSKDLSASKETSRWAGKVSPLTPNQIKMRLNHNFKKGIRQVFQQLDIRTIKPEELGTDMGPDGAEKVPIRTISCQLDNQGPKDVILQIGDNEAGCIYLFFTNAGHWWVFNGHQSYNFYAYERTMKVWRGNVGNAFIIFNEHPRLGTGMSGEDEDWLRIVARQMVPVFNYTKEYVSSFEDETRIWKEEAGRPLLVNNNYEVHTTFTYQYTLDAGWDDPPVASLPLLTRKVRLVWNEQEGKFKEVGTQFYAKSFNIENYYLEKQFTDFKGYAESTDAKLRKWIRRFVENCSDKSLKSRFKTLLAEKCD